MDDDSASEGISFLGEGLRACFERRVVTIEPSRERPYDEAEWLDAIIVVECGEIELESLSGDRCTFRRGDVLWLVGMPLRALRNRGQEPVVLVAVSRRQAS